MRESGINEVWSPASQHRYMLLRIKRAEAKNQRTLRDFARWLADVRDLGQRTITVRIGSASTFVDAMTSRCDGSCARAFRSITVVGIEAFFVDYGKGHGIASRRQMKSAMQLFLEFAACRGWIGRELVDAVPSLISYRLGGLPRGVSDDQLSKLLGTQWNDCQCPRRDRAILLLLAIYGVRREQASALQLVDIDWHERAIRFAAHKGGKAIHHTLTEAVADALADYLRNERPPSDCDYVFLRHPRPHSRLGPGPISNLVAARMRSCGLPALHPHAFRHAFATRLLRADQPVKAIADLLGHRSLAAVAIYAKVDYTRLLAVAVEWPEEATS